MSVSADVNGVKATSDVWQEVLMREERIVVYDPDGWDRKNFMYSWYEEQISWVEFRRRAALSTCIPAKYPRGKNAMPLKIQVQAQGWGTVKNPEEPEC